MGKVDVVNLKKKLVVSAVCAFLVAGSTVGPASADKDHPYWNQKVKCETRDQEGHRIPTRIGNSELGWNHLSGRHNIKRCTILGAALRGKARKVDGPRRVYREKAGPSNSKKEITVEVIVQYARQTADKDYKTKKGEKVGVITAYCKGMNKCPSWLNK